MQFILVYAADRERSIRIDQSADEMCPVDDLSIRFECSFDWYCVTYTSAISDQPTAIAMCMNGLGVQQAASVGILLAKAHPEATPTTLIISLRGRVGLARLSNLFGSTSGPAPGG